MGVEHFIRGNKNEGKPLNIKPEVIRQPPREQTWLRKKRMNRVPNNGK